MKILYDYKIFLNQSVGGPSRYFVELIKEIIKINEDIKILSPIYINKYLNEIDNKYKNGYYFKNKKYFGKLFNFYNKIISNHYLKNYHYDILHTTYYDDQLTKKKPIVATVYDLIHERYYSEYKLSKYHKKLFFDKIDHFICISKNTQKDLIEHYNIKEEKTSVIYLSNFRLTDDLSNKFKHKNQFFLYVGSRKRYKNFILLLKTFSNNNDIKKNFDIICFGGGKFLKEELDFFSDLKLNINKIHQVDGEDKILSYLYKNASAYICTSEYEGFGLPILEAMSCSCPVISSNASSLPEVYGNAALSFDPRSSQELEDCILKIINDSELRRNYIKMGLENIEKFSWKKCAQETLKVYNSLN